MVSRRSCHEYDSRGSGAPASPALKSGTGRRDNDSAPAYRTTAAGRAMPDSPPANLLVPARDPFTSRRARRYGTTADGSMPVGRDKMATRPSIRGRGSEADRTVAVTTGRGNLRFERANTGGGDDPEFCRDRVSRLIPFQDDRCSDLTHAKAGFPGLVEPGLEFRFRLIPRRHHAIAEARRLGGASDDRHHLPPVPRNRKNAP